MGRVGAALFTIALLMIVLETTCARRASPVDDTDIEDLYAVPQGMRRFKVLRVVDGDTLWLQEVGRVRLLGVNAPESVHPSRPIEPCGLAASHEVWKLINGRTVGLEVSARAGRDMYGRLLAYVWYRGDLGKRLLRGGLARVERRWPFEKRALYEAAEKEARLAQRGIWSERQCVPLLPGAQLIEDLPKPGLLADGLLVQPGGLQAQELPLLPLGGSRLLSQLRPLPGRELPHPGRPAKARACDAVLTAREAPLTHDLRLRRGKGRWRHQRAAGGQPGGGGQLLERGSDRLWQGTRASLPFLPRLPEAKQVPFGSEWCSHEPTPYQNSTSKTT